MTEGEARAEVEKIVGDRATTDLNRLANCVIVENGRQNLISSSTIAIIWSRHILDSIQLLQWAGRDDGMWIDIGTGGGFPGLAIAICSPRAMTLVEPRSQRANFLRTMVSEFGLHRTRVVQSRIERPGLPHATIISARAVTSIASLFAGATHCSTAETRWLLPRGAGWQNELAEARIEWKGMFHVEQSLSDTSSRIVVASGVARR